MKTWEMPELEKLSITETACPSDCELAANNGQCTHVYTDPNPNCPNCPNNPANQNTDRLS